MGLCEALGWPFLRGPLQRLAERNNGVRVEFGEQFKLRLLFSPGLQVDRLSIGAAPGFDVPHLVAGRDIDVRWRWSDVLRWRRGEGPLHLRQLHAAYLDAHLLRDAGGRATWQIGARKTPEPADAPREALPRVDSLRVTTGRIVVDDRPTNTDLLVTMESLGPVSAGPAAANVPAASAPAPAADGATGTTTARAGYHASIKGRHRGVPLELRVTAGALLPLAGDAEAGSDEQSGRGAVPFRVEGQAGQARILFDGQAAALLGARRLDGVLHLRGPSLARVGEPLGLTLPETAPFDLAGRLGNEGGIWRLVAERFALGRTRLAGDFVFDGNRQPRHLSGKLTGSVLALPDLGPAIGATAPAQPVARSSGKVLPQRRFDLPSLQAMSADVQVAIDRFEFGGAALTPLTALHTHLVLERGVLRLDDLQAQVAGGHLAGATRYDGNLQPPRWDADLRFAGVDVAGWVRAVQSPEVRKAKGAPAAPARTLRNERRTARAQAEAGTVQPVLAYLTGVLTSEVQVQGRGRSTAEILGTLQGRAQGMLRDGTMSHLVTELMGLDIAETLGVMVRGDRPLTLRCARVDLAIQGGIATPRLAVFDNTDSTIRVNGTINLRDEALDLRAVASPKDFSPFTLRSPVRVTGTLGDPKVAIDGNRLVAKAAAAAVLGAVAAPLAALIPFLDRGKKVEDPCLAEPAQRPAAASGAASGGTR
ncbi:MAG: AsmA family protein [Burkholderiaceae bacterium]